MEFISCLRFLKIYDNTSYIQFLKYNDFKNRNMVLINLKEVFYLTNLPFVDRNKYFSNLGFTEDPFASTNALHEEMLPEYFINPPYFSALIGDVNKPKSSIIIAPRGTGKTAQRKMLEKYSEVIPELICIVYDDFPIENRPDLNNITLEIHLIKINKCLLIALLCELYSRNIEKAISMEEKKTLTKLIELYLHDINTSDINYALNSIKGISGKIKDIWNVANEGITSVVNIILTKHGIPKVNLDKVKDDSTVIKNSEVMDHFNVIEILFESIGIGSVFILIDRVDETSLTGNDSKETYKLIQPLIKDLRLLERKTIVFKFFLWDKLEEHWSEDIRKDRIDIFKIEWNIVQIKELLDKRLNGFSNNKIGNLSSILDCNAETLEYIYIFSKNSPRDAINIMKTIFTEHLNINSSNSNLQSLPNSESIIKGIEMFSEEKFTEIITQRTQQKELQSIKSCTFTINHLYNEIFKCESSTARNKLMPWTRAGFIYTSPNKIKVHNKPNSVNLYTFDDIRISRHVCSNQKFNEFMERNVITCFECNTINLFDKKNIYNVNDWQCTKCSSKIL